MIDSRIFRTFRQQGILNLVCLLLCAPAAMADQDAQRVKQVKAAFILNISRFVAWPPEVFEKESSPYNLCLYRSNIFGEVLDSISHKRISGRQLKIDVIDGMGAVNDCTILFIPGTELSHYKSEVERALNRPMLTISDLTADEVATGISHAGVMVSMVRESTRIGIEVDLQQTRDAGLRMSSQLLKLARIVTDGND